MAAQSKPCMFQIVSISSSQKCSILAKVGAGVNKFAEIHASGEFTVNQFAFATKN